MTVKQLLYRLFLTRDDQIDTFQLSLLFLQVFFVVWVTGVSRWGWTMNVDQLRVFNTIYVLTFIAGGPRWVVEKLINVWAGRSQSSKVES